MTRFCCIIFTLGFLFARPLLANEEKADGPCKVIKEACESAGFVKGQAKDGTGLFVDCIKPIMQGTPQPKKAAKPLPQVDPGQVAACKAAHPHFGQGHKGGKKAH